MFRNPIDFHNCGARDCYVNCLNYLVTNYIEMLEEKNDIKLINKTGVMGDKISAIELQFEYYEMLDVQGSRQMMLQLIDSFVQSINSYDRLRPYLECPFTQDNVSIRVNFISKRKFSYPQPGEVKYMSYMDGVITYMAENPRCLGDLEKIRAEPISFARMLAYPIPPPGCSDRFPQ